MVLGPSLILLLLLLLLFRNSRTLINIFVEEISSNLFLITEAIIVTVSIITVAQRY